MCCPAVLLEIVITWTNEVNYFLSVNDIEDILLRI